MKPRHVQASTSLLIVLVMATVVWLNAGDLNPPVGPVTPTMKTLVEVEPRIAINATNTPGDADGTPSLYKISQPGSYYLTGNITGVAAKYGIEIAASGVTLDLNGFDLLGVAGSLDGVSATVGSLRDIAVVNGSVRNWGGGGVDLGTMSARDCRVADLLASGNTAGNGISPGLGSTVTNCSAAFNGASGIFAGGYCTVSNCSATSNTYNGIYACCGAAVSNCSANANAGSGIYASSGCAVQNCGAYYNTGDGFATDSGCTLSNCMATQNTGNGISTTYGTTISNCSGYLNTGIGIVVSGGAGATVSNCAAYYNNGGGISVNNGSVVADCTTGLNALDGIVCSSGCVIRGNTCWFNGWGGDGADIHATGDDSRIEGNNCTGADRGIDVDLAGNIIIKNTCSGNATNWDVVAGNVCLVVQGVAGAAILGDTGGAAPGSTDPNANFTY